HNTSRTCHHCGHINKELKVKTRNWKCQKCGKILDRDINAAINILNRWFNGDSLK
ncbi:zinc ribbon domain-containing protein, partial [uncultured Methanobrevibacter sp.]